ncbi:hypothetical protein MSG28_011681 [Choristoneura fumiferana]|uniref:Uncharacterized protein n=1 Tax=Choristoneura fumiferana TaxID=7141 RepID=A0ACC0KLE1_CHOFU|nr:hypothetical protein MSG28_011681 [Choristoneura fumiferana]
MAVPRPSCAAFFCLLVLCFTHLSEEKEKQILDQILGPGRYDARIRPSGINGTDGPAVVSVNIFVRSISKIDDVTMEYSVQLTFREQWLDERLKFNNLGGRLKYLTLTEANRVWMPDLFFSNEKEGHFHNIIMPNVYIRIFPNGNVVKNLHLPRFTLEKFLTDYCNSKTNTGVTTLLTMATQSSGINASLPPVSYTKAIDVWTGVCLTFVFGALLEFALVNYASRSDMHRENMKKTRREMEAATANLDAASDLLDTDSNATFAMKPLRGSDKMRQCEVHMKPTKKNWCRCCRTWMSKFPTRSKRIDVISRITFPLVFAFFNLAYWSTYLIREEEDEN